jgi:hypothetical protein
LPNLLILTLAVLVVVAVRSCPRNIVPILLIRRGTIPRQSQPQTRIEIMQLNFDIDDAISLAHTSSAVRAKQLIFDNLTAFYIAKKIINSDPNCNIISEGDFWWKIKGDEFGKCDFQITFEITTTTTTED